MSEIIKQEGDFKMQKPRKPKNLSKADNITKVDLSAPAAEQEITKVIIPNTEEDAIQESSTEKSVLRAEQPEVELQEMGERDERPIEDVIQEIESPEVDTQSIENEIAHHVQEQAATGKPLPENIEKLVAFMEETGGTIEDYSRLNIDYSSINSEVLLKEYYKIDF